MSSPRILIVTNRAPYPFMDGGNLAMRAMIEGYARAGWVVQLLTMNTLRHPVAEAAIRRAYSNIQIDIVPVDNRIKPLATIRNFLFSSQPNHAERFFDQTFVVKLENLLVDFKPDVVQLESIYLSTYLPSIRKHKNVYTVLRLHNIEYKVWESLVVKTTNPLKRIYLSNLAKRIAKFERQAWNNFDLLLPITETDAEIVKSEGIITPMVIAPFGIDTSKIQTSETGNVWHAYHIGAMDWLPNEEAINWFLKDVWPLINKEHPEMQFFFAGRKMPEKYMEWKQAGVYCMGEVSNAIEFIKDKKILVVPLRSGGGIRVKILEAMAMGKVVISTAVGMQGIDAIADVHYLLADKPDAFVKAVNWCLGHKQEADTMGLNATNLIRTKYEVSTIMQNVLNKLTEQLKA